MLKLQRASAGSGKTYTLAKTYIFNLISVKNDNGTFRLPNNSQEIAEGVRAILAITFTNKATEEMKSRIIDKLYALTTDLPEKKIDYLSEFMEKLHCSRKDLQQTCSDALTHILDDYSSFAVSTIDSFFQLVLRTFAYETDLNQNYQVEIDSKGVIKMGIEEALASVVSGEKGSEQLKEGIRRLMLKQLRNGKNWNIFARSTSSDSVYSTLVNQVKLVESERFKEIKQHLDDYFAANPDFNKLIDTLNQRYNEYLDNLKRDIRFLALGIRQQMAELDISEIKNGRKTLTTQLRNVLAGNYKKVNLFDADKENKPSPFVIDPQSAQWVSIDKDIREMFDKVSHLTEYLESVGYVVWQAFSSTLPWLKLILDVASKSREYLDEIGAVQLSDTNSMLRDIISYDETPFIYERLGTRFMHYLIDEFQDTSTLQWENMHPLLRESLSHAEDYDNLIIGDAKQSIYRFRNADSSLITHKVPSDPYLHHFIVNAGNSKEENTNWRSDKNIVGFNNFFFHLLARYIDSTFEFGDYFKNLYSNVVQYPRKQDENGYVEVHFFPDSDNETDTSDDESGAPSYPQYFSYIPQLIADMLKRGYRQRDICILASKNAIGTNSIQAIIDYNNANPAATPIDFVSETSLAVESSQAVSIIVASLESLLEGNARRNTNSDSRKRLNWRNIANDYNYFALKNPELGPIEIIEKFLEQSSDCDSMQNLLDSLPTLALPALVEGIIETFVQPLQLRQSQAPFIAAFQDFVLEYCENNPADIASFLRYWNTRKDSLCISSPEDTDAVQVMTIHKSKGLEYKCVIVADVDQCFEPKIDEWKWVEPKVINTDNPDLAFPAYLPIQLSKSLKTSNTPYAADYDEYARYVAQDNINAAYVAFTRAENELYLLSNTPTLRSNNSYLRYILFTELSKLTDYIGNLDKSERPEWMINPSLMKIYNKNEEIFSLPEMAKSKKKSAEVVFKFGRQYDKAPVKSDNNDSKTPGEIEEERKYDIIRHHITDYPVAIENCLTTFRPANDNTCSSMINASHKYTFDDDENPDDDDRDPRAFGTLMHSIMEDISTFDDMPRAFRRMKLSGKMSRKMQAEARHIIETALRELPHKHWFDGSMRVENERDLIRGHGTLLRPDRFMIAPDGSVTIVDYKFGLQHTPASQRKYLNQVKEYAQAMRAAGFGKPISTYVWYLRQNRLDQGETI